MLLAAPLERSLPSAGICSAETQRGMKGWREENTRTSPTPAMGEAWCYAGEQMGVEEVVGGAFEKFMFPTSMLKAETQDGFSETERVCEEDDTSSSI